MLHDDHTVLNRHLGKAVSFTHTEARMGHELLMWMAGDQESRHVPGQEMQVLLALKDVFASMDAACQASLHGPPSAPLSAVVRPADGRATDVVPA